ncbi:hypothetical protein Nepgr_015700 [Nepenthes gracilis]|uniref:Cytochrome P450 n=1 Tax=Nepenthes gracilis TaxID=150966 RepID=A0AAD3XRC2_NEPGR|nr:hypothetical protein Nepgr_015700 [Nepenthes gracilis]
MEHHLQVKTCAFATQFALPLLLCCVIWSRRRSNPKRRPPEPAGSWPLIGHLRLLADALPFLRWLDIGGYEKNMRRTVKQLDSIIQGWLEKHKRVCSSREANDQQDFIDTMLDILHIAQEKPSSFEMDTIIKATCLDVILAETDTTIVTLTWALSLLLNNRHMLKKAQEELDSIVGKERLVNDSNMENLVYLQAIIRETMQLYPCTSIWST